MLEVLSLLGLLTTAGVAGWALWLSRETQREQREGILEAYRLAKAVHPAEARLSAEQYQAIRQTESAAANLQAHQDAARESFVANLGS